MATPIQYAVRSAPPTFALSEDVQQIFRQKGAFNLVTEKRLLDELSTANPDVSDEDTSDEEETETAQATKDRLFTVKAEIQQQVNKVQQDLLTLIDALSLVTSSSSRLGQNSMSPALRAAGAKDKGTVKTVEPKSQNQTTLTSELTNVSCTYRSEALDSASKSILDAASRLDAEAQRQARYWQHLAHLKANTWSISRRPNDDRALVVHFSPVNAGPQYRAKGVAPLQQDEEGDLSIAGQIDAQKQKILYVSVIRHARITGRYAWSSPNTGSLSDIEQHLMSARDSLSREELFTEATKEARLIANLDVKHRGSSIQMYVSEECSIALSFERQGPLSIGEQRLPDDDIAFAIASNLRLMLVAEHRQNYARRSQTRPRPVSLISRPAPEYVILRPILAHLRHYSLVSRFLQHLKELETSIHKAGFDLDCKSVSLANSSLSLMGSDSLKGKIVSGYLLSLPTGSSVHLNVETYLAGPLYGTKFMAAKHQSDCGVSSLAPFSTVKEALNFVGDVLARDIGCMLLKRSWSNGSWQLKQEHPLRMGFVGDNGLLMMLAVSCDDRDLLIDAQSKNKKKYQADWAVQDATVKRSGQEQSNETTVVEFLESWLRET